MVQVSVLKNFFGVICATIGLNEGYADSRVNCIGKTYITLATNVNGTNFFRRY